MTHQSSYQRHGSNAARLGRARTVGIVAPGVEPARLGEGQRVGIAAGNLGVARKPPHPTTTANPPGPVCANERQEPTRSVHACIRGGPDLDDAAVLERLDKARLGDAAGGDGVEALAQLAAVAGAPRQDVAVVGDGDAVARARSDLRDPESLQVVDHLGPQAALGVAQLAMVVVAKGVHRAAVGQHQRVARARRNALDVPAVEELEPPGRADIVRAAVAELALAAVAPCTWTRRRRGGHTQVSATQSEDLAGARGRRRTAVDGGPVRDHGRRCRRGGLASEGRRLLRRGRPPSPPRPGRFSRAQPA